MEPNEFPAPYLLSLPEGNWNINGEKSLDDEYLYVAGPLERSFEVGNHTVTSEGVTEIFHVYPVEGIVTHTEDIQDSVKTHTYIYDDPLGNRNEFSYSVPYTVTPTPEPALTLEDVNDALLALTEIVLGGT
jgi:hypothetical protein